MTKTSIRPVPPPPLLSTLRLLNMLFATTQREGKSFIVLIYILCLHGLAAPEFFSGNNGDCGIDTLGVLGSISLQQNLSSPVFKSHPQRVGGPLVSLKSRKK